MSDPAKPEPWIPPRERPTPAMDHRRGGLSESQYHPRIAAVILARLDAGETVRQVAADDWMPSYATIYHWVKIHPEFGDRWRALRADQGSWKIERRMLREEARAWRTAHEVKLGMRRRRGAGAGRKSTYTQAAADAFCARVADGETVMAICADPAMPSARAIYKWLRRRPEFRAAYVEAKAIQKFALEVTIDDIVCETTPANFAAAKAEVARLEGRIGRLTAKTYRALPRVWD